MKKLTYSLLFMFPFLLAACGPPMIFGIPQEQWDQLNQQQRSQVIAGYNQCEQTKAQVAPLVAAVDALAAKSTPPPTIVVAPPSTIHTHPHHHHRHNFMDPNFDIDNFPTL